MRWYAAEIPKATMSVETYTATEVTRAGPSTATSKTMPAGNTQRNAPRWNMPRSIGRSASRSIDDEVMRAPPQIATARIPRVARYNHTDTDVVATVTPASTAVVEPTTRAIDVTTRGIIMPA